MYRTNNPIITFFLLQQIAVPPFHAAHPRRSAFFMKGNNDGNSERHFLHNSSDSDCRNSRALFLAGMEKPVMA